MKLGVVGVTVRCVFVCAGAAGVGRGVGGGGVDAGLLIAAAATFPAPKINALIIAASLFESV